MPGKIIDRQSEDFPYVLNKLGEKFQGKVDFRQTAFICAQHSMKTTAAMFQVLKDLGARHLFDLGKIYSNSDVGVTALKQLLNKWEQFEVKAFEADKIFEPEELEKDTLFSRGDRWYFFDRELNAVFDLHQGIIQTKVDKELFEGVRRKIEECGISIPEDLLGKLFPLLGRTRYFEHPEHREEIIKESVYKDGVQIQPGGVKEFSKQIYEPAVEEMVEAFKTHLASLPKGEIKNIVILDDGGRVIGTIANQSDSQGNFCGYPVGAVEQTAAGSRDVIYEWVKGVDPEKLAIPVVAVSASAVKQIFEPHFITEAVFRTIIDQFSDLNLKPPNGRKFEIGLVGYGTIGKGVAEKIKEMGHGVYICDSNQKKQREITEKFGVKKKRKWPDLISEETDFIIGTTGIDITDKQAEAIIERLNADIDLSEHVNPDGKRERTLISCSSENKEFLTLIQYCFKLFNARDPRIKRIRFLKRIIQHRDGETEDPIPDMEIELEHCVLRILRSGYPINFAPHCSGKDQTVQCSVPSNQIQTTVGCLLGGIIQAHELSGAIDKSRDNPQTGHPRTGHQNFFRLWPVFQNLVVKYWLEDKRSGYEDEESKEYFDYEQFNIFRYLREIEERSAYDCPMPKDKRLTYHAGRKSKIVESISTDPSQHRWGEKAEAELRTYYEYFGEGIDTSKCSSNRVELIKGLKACACAKQMVPYIFSPYDDVATVPDHQHLGEMNFHIKNKGSKEEFPLGTLFSNNEHCLQIEGPPGVGKTRLCQRLYYDWAMGKIWQDKFDFVILIEVRALCVWQHPESVSFFDMVYQEYRRQLPHNQDFSSRNEFEFFIKGNHKKVLFILDGCEESDPAIQSKFINELFSEKKQYCVLCTTRHECLPQAFELHVNHGYVNEGFEERDVSEYVDNFFKEYADWEKEQLLTFMNENSTVSGFSRIPLQLELFCLIWGDHYCFSRFTSNEPITLLWLYDEVFKLVWKRYQVKCRRERSGLRQDIANQVPQLRKLAFDCLEKDSFEINWAPEELDALLTSGFIERVGGESSHLCQFVHTSFLEYYAARHLIDAMFSSVYLPFEVNHPLNQKSLIDQSGVIHFIMHSVSGNQLRIDYLFGIIRSSICQEVQRAAANAITVLNTAGVSFSGMDLRGIRIPNANMRGGMLDHTNLEHADLSGVNFQGAWLRDANLNGAKMDGVHFGELPSIENGGLCCYSADRSFLLVLKNKTAFIYDSNTNQLQREFQGELEFSNVTLGPLEEFVVGGEGQVFLCNMTDVGLECYAELKQNTTCIHDLAFHSKTRLLAAGNEDRTIALWVIYEKPRLPELLKIFEGHEGRITSVTFNPSGNILASSSTDGMIHLWNTFGDRSCLCVLSLRLCSVNTIVFSSNDHLISGSSDGMLRIWDIGQKRCLGSFLEEDKEHKSSILCIKFAPNDILISGDNSSIIRLWRVCGIELICLNIITGYGTGIKNFDFGPNNLLAIVDNKDNETIIRCRYINYHFDHLDNFFCHQEKVTSIAFGPNGVLASGSEDNKVCLWDTNTGNLLLIFTGHTSKITSIAFSLIGQLASGSKDKTVRLWYVGRDSGILEHSSEVSSIAFNLDGALLAVGGLDRIVNVWNLERQICCSIFRYHMAPIGGVVFGRDDLIFSRGEIGCSTSAEPDCIYAWYPLEAKQRVLFSIHDHRTQCHALSSKGLLAIGRKDGQISIWDTNDIRAGQECLILRGHKQTCRAVSFGPDHLFASSSSDNTLRLWDLYCKKCVAVFKDLEGINSIAWYKDGKGRFLATGSDDYAVRFWRVIQEGNIIKIVLYWASQPEDLIAHHIRIQSVVGLSECNLRLLNQCGAVVNSLIEGDVIEESNCVSVKIFCPNETVELNFDEAITENAMHPSFYLRGHQNAVQNIAFSPVSRYVIFGQENGTISVWEADTGRFLYAFQGHEGKVTNISFGTDHLFASKGDNEVSLWCIGRRQKLLSYSKSAVSLTFGLYQQHLLFALADQKMIYLLKIEKNCCQFLGELVVHPGEDITHIVFSPNHWLVSLTDAHIACGLYRVCVWNIEDAYERGNIPAFHYLSERYVDRWTVIPDWYSLNCLQSFNIYSSVCSVAFCQDGLFALGYKNGVIEIWSVIEPKKCLSLLQNNERAIIGLVFGANNILASADCCELRLWDIVHLINLNKQFDKLRNDRDNLLSYMQRLNYCVENVHRGELFSFMLSDRQSVIERVDCFRSGERFLLTIKQSEKSYCWHVLERRNDEWNIVSHVNREILTARERDERSARNLHSHGIFKIRGEELGKNDVITPRQHIHRPF